MTKIPITNRKREVVAHAFVDDSDADRVLKKKWSLHSRGYAVSGDYSKESGNKIILLHHFVFGKKKGLDVDHINRNKLDCRKANLRFCTHAENNANNGSRGVSRVTGTKSRWRAYYVRGGVQKHVGCYGSEEDAAHAREIAIKKL